MIYLISFATAGAATIIFAPFVIPVLRRLKVGQAIRLDGPRAHFGKAGTPTMGGIIFLLPIIIIAWIIAPFNLSTFLLVFITFGFGLIGFADDYNKVVWKRSLGLKARYKLSFQILLSLILAFVSVVFLDRGTGIWIPFWGEMVLGWFYLPFVVLVVVSATNAVNLTDGLDGLAAGTTAIAALAFIFISIVAKNKEAAVFSAALLGGCMGFLIYNFNPAKVFMGDTGSLALGAALATLAVLTKTEILLIIIGGVFVIETLSVILQVAAFRIFGKRIFRMSPLHHHFELKGWGERSIVLRFYVIALLFGLLGIIIFIFAF
ncbi:MAG: phospho-N-acetylmuramoyl-pentapeptide-transferase [Bacillota bacterium]